jgi:hypothetical protein
MIRELFSLPAAVDYESLLNELRAVDEGIVDCNDVAGELAVYSESQIDRSAVSSVISAHFPPQFKPLDPAGSLATLLVVEGVLVLEDAANAIHEEPQHLIAEAEAWTLG